MVRDVNDALAAVGKADYRLPEAEKRQLLGRRSIFVAADIRKGEPFTKKNIRVVRPGHGLRRSITPGTGQDRRAGPDLRPAAAKGRYL